MRLSPEAFAYLQRLVGDRYPTAADLVAAADWYEQQQSRAVQ
jgi:hypothetical protein